MLPGWGKYREVVERPERLLSLHISGHINHDYLCDEITRAKSNQKYLLQGDY